MPAHHQVMVCSSVVACRPPMNISVPDPPPSDASPPPCPACSRMAAAITMAIEQEEDEENGVHGAAE